MANHRGPLTLLRDVWGWAEEGHKHDIPTCCGIRFGIGWERPKIGWFLPHPFLRPWVRLQSLYPNRRHAFAIHDQQGYVPCEYHLLRWIVTGKRPAIRQDEFEDKWSCSPLNISHD